MIYNTKQISIYYLVNIFNYIISIYIILRKDVKINFFLKISVFKLYIFVKFQKY